MVLSIFIEILFSNYTTVANFECININFYRIKEKSIGKELSLMSKENIIDQKELLKEIKSGQCYQLCYTNNI